MEGDTVDPLLKVYHHQDNRIDESKWSNLPDDILLKILDHLALADSFRFGSVCRSWRSVRCHLAKPPLLMLYWHNGVSVSNMPWSYSIYSPYNGRYKPLSFKSGHGFWRHIKSYGPSMCWLAASNECGMKYFLLNPISGEQIDFPPIRTMYCAALSKAPTSENCIVITYNNKVMASCKLGDKAWRVFEKRNPQESICGMAFHKGELYILLRNGNTKVYAIDPYPRLTSTISQIVKSNNLYLLESGKELLLVACPSRAHYQPVEFQVFKLEADGWVRAKSLGNQMLFLSELRVDSFSVKEFNCSDFNGNCIFYHKMFSSNSVIYSMEDGSSKFWTAAQFGPIGVGFMPLSLW